MLNDFPSQETHSPTPAAGGNGANGGKNGKGGLSGGAIAGIVSPLFFGAVYSASVGTRPILPFIGSAFLIAALVLAGAALLGRAAGRKQDDPAPA